MRNTRLEIPNGIKGQAIRVMIAGTRIEPYTTEKWQMLKCYRDEGDLKSGTNRCQVSKLTLCEALLNARGGVDFMNLVSA